MAAVLPSAVAPPSSPSRGHADRATLDRFLPLLGAEVRATNIEQLKQGLNAIATLASEADSPPRAAAAAAEAVEAEDVPRRIRGKAPPKAKDFATKKFVPLAAGPTKVAPATRRAPAKSQPTTKKAETQTQLPKAKATAAAKAKASPKAKATVAAKPTERRSSRTAAQVPATRELRRTTVATSKRAAPAAPSPKTLKTLKTSGLTKSAVRRLARRAGVQRLASDVYDETRDALNKFLDDVLNDVVTFTEYGRRKTASVDDVCQSLRRNGRAVYGLRQK